MVCLRFAYGLPTVCLRFAYGFFFINQHAYMPKYFLSEI